MAEAIPSSVADRVLERLNSEAVQVFCSICGLNSQLLILKHTISSIRLRLPAAELALSPSSSVLNWVHLDLIQDAIFEADELLDIISVEAQRHQLRPGNKILKQVCTFFSNSSNPVGFFFNMGYKLRKINKKLTKFATQEHIQALSNTESNNKEEKKEIHSFELAYEVVGREDDKIELMQLLLQDDCDNVSVIPILGPGGLGKTTLANLVFNDETILNHFELRMWVCVSEYLDLRFVAEKIIRSLTGKYLGGDIEIDQLQKIIHKEINWKRFLLVVDDLQDHVNESEWLSLKKLVGNGAKGSGIIVTTRSERVSKVTSTDVVYELGELDVEQSWSLFKRIAFVRGQEPTNRSIKEIGLKIVRKCNRNPLAIITIGSMLYFKDQAEWSSLFENELSKIQSQGQDSSGGSDVLPILKVSYDHLPSHLKHCFAYCSLFPRDHDLNVQALVNLWMAQEFIKSSDNTTKHFEDVGYDYFMVLLWRSFFHETKMDKWGNVIECKIPNLMHDLANLVTGWQCARLDLNGKCIHPITHDLDLKRIQYQSRDTPGKKKKNILLPEFMDHERTRHVLLHFNLDSPWCISTSLVQAKNIRTFLLHNELPWKMEGRMGKSNCDAVISSLKSLRVLDLHDSGIETLSNSICKLKHLRYLDLSNNFDIKLLPNCITLLQNLETLKLSYCRKLKELPRDIRKLVNLRHLEIDGCCSLTYMPRGLGQLTCLQTLSEFVLIKDAAFRSKHYCAKLVELMKLNNLRGELRIKNLRLGMDDQAAANLKEKHHLRSLTLIWDVDEKHNEVIDKSKEGLQLHPNLEELVIYGYKGAEFSFLLSSLTNLVKLSLRNCTECQHLPILYTLHSLEVLVLDEMHALEYISDKFENETQSSSKQLLSSLKEVRITDLPNLKGWWRVDVVAADAKDDNSVSTRSISPKSDNQSLASFSRLSKLVIEDCPKLISMPLYPSLEELLLLGNASWKTLQKTMMNDVESFSFSPLSKLKVLCIIKMNEVDICNDDAVLWQNFKSLHTSKLDRLSNLSSLPDGLQYTCKLQELYIQHCSGLTEIPEWICNLKTLEKLVILDCPNLTSLPDRMLQLTSSLLTLEIEDCPKLGHIQNMKNIKS